MVVRKTLAYLIISLSSCLGVNKAGGVGQLKKFITSFSYIGPFIEGTDDYTISSNVSPTISNTSIREKMRVYLIDGSIVKTEVKEAHSVKKNVDYSLTFTLPFKSALTKRGLNIVIDFLNSSNESLQNFSFNIKPIQPTRINPKDYLNDYYSVSDIIVDPDNYKTVASEQYKFDSFIDYFNVDNYYRLRLDNIIITYSSVLECPPGLAHLHFVDYLKLFPYLDNNEEVPTFDVPLTVTRTKSSTNFNFPSNMYVKPKSLEMSLVARPGFVTTKYFYLPINHCSDLLDQTFTIVVDKFGHNQNSFSWDVRYINNRNLIGDCANSDYCVVGEITNG